MHIDVNVPILTNWLAVEFIYVCRTRPAQGRVKHSLDESARSISL